MKEIPEVQRIIEDNCATVILREKELPVGYNLRPMTGNDYKDYIALVENTWPGLPANVEHDVDAITSSAPCPAIFDTNNRMIGASYNLIGYDQNTFQIYLLVHMLGVAQDQQGTGIGQKLMRENYAFVASNESLSEVRLTSDPLEAGNVTFYLRHMGMAANSYKYDAYKHLNESGGAQHRGLPADRFLYKSRPDSAWVRQRILPNEKAYEAYIQYTPNSAINFELYEQGQLPTQIENGVIFMEMPRSIAEVKESSIEIAQMWRNFHREVTARAFESDYTAVDVMKTKDRAYIVMMRDFDEMNPECLKNKLLESVQK